jgi:hypothetical protein
MRKDSTVIDMGGFVIKEVTETSDSTIKGKGNGKEMIETHVSKDPMRIVQPVFFLYGMFFVLLALMIIILGWYYLKKKAEIAKMMIQNNMSPAGLFKATEEGKIGNFLKFGILFVAMGLALLINKLLVTAGLYMYMGPVLFLCMGLALILIHRLNKK